MTEEKARPQRLRKAESRGASRLTPSTLRHISDLLLRPQPRVEIGVGTSLRDLDVMHQQTRLRGAIQADK